MTTNSLIVVTTDGVIVADGQGSVAATERMIAEIKKLTPQPIKYVVVCSDHGDHTAGNAAFKASFPNVVLIASPVSQKALAASAVPPAETVSDKRTIRLGGKEVEILNLGRAHTGGDPTAYVPAGKVLFISEAYFHCQFPAMRAGYPSEWLAAIGKVQAMNATWYIPGHGFVDDAPTLKAELEEARKAIAHVIKEGARLHALGLGLSATGARNASAAMPGERQSRLGPLCRLDPARHRTAERDLAGVPGD